MSLDTAKAVAKLRSLTKKFDHSVENAMPFYPELCTLMPSDGADEEYGGLGSMPGMREWLGDRDFHSLRAGKFTIENKEWENSVEIPRTAIEDDRMGLYGPVMEQMGVEAAHHPDELVMELLRNGESQSCMDGQYFFDTDHAWGDSGTQSNDLTYNASDHTAVTETEAGLAYHAARTAMLNFKRDNGKTYVRPTIKPFSKLLLLVPATLELVFQKAINKTLVAAGETNVVLDKPLIIPFPDTYLTSGVKFWLLNVGGPLKPFIFQARRPLSRQMKGVDDREFKDVKFMTDARYNAGYFAWWTAVQTEFN